MSARLGCAWKNASGSGAATSGMRCTTAPITRRVSDSMAATMGAGAPRPAEPDGAADALRSPIYQRAVIRTPK